MHRNRFPEQDGQHPFHFPVPVRRLAETGFIFISVAGLSDEDPQTSPEILISHYQIRERLLRAARKGIRSMREQNNAMVQSVKAPGMRKKHFTFLQQGDDLPELPDLMRKDAGDALIITAVLRGKQSMEGVEQIVFRREDGSEAVCDGLYHRGQGQRPNDRHFINAAACPGDTCLSLDARRFDFVLLAASRCRNPWIRRISLRALVSLKRFETDLLVFYIYHPFVVIIRIRREEHAAGIHGS